MPLPDSLSANFKHTSQDVAKPAAQNGYNPPVKPCCTTASKICYFDVDLGFFFFRCPSPPSSNWYKSPADPKCLHNGRVKFNSRRQGQAGKGRFKGRTRSPSWIAVTFWAAAATFREQPAEGTRSSSLFHWKASQSARAFADKHKTLPRTFGSLGKGGFFFATLPCTQQHQEQQRPPTTTYNLFALNLPAKCPLRLQDSMGFA